MTVSGILWGGISAIDMVIVESDEEYVSVFMVLWMLNIGVGLWVYVFVVCKFWLEISGQERVKFMIWTMHSLIALEAPQLVTL
jgi:hypothetical protein